MVVRAEAVVGVAVEISGDIVTTIVAVAGVIVERILVGDGDSSLGAVADERGAAVFTVLVILSGEVVYRSGLVPIDIGDVGADLVGGEAGVAVFVIRAETSAADECGAVVFAPVGAGSGKDASGEEGDEKE